MLAMSSSITQQGMMLLVACFSVGSAAALYDHVKDFIEERRK